MILRIFNIITHAMLKRFPNKDMTVYIYATGGLVCKPRFSITRLKYWFKSAFYSNGNFRHGEFFPWHWNHIKLVNSCLLTKEIKILPVFKNIVTDFSSANLNSVMNIFNLMDYLKNGSTDFDENCYTKLIGYKIIYYDIIYIC